MCSRDGIRTDVKVQQDSSARHVACFMVPEGRAEKNEKGAVCVIAISSVDGIARRRIAPV